jgi:hypothetical protein
MDFRAEICVTNTVRELFCVFTFWTFRTTILSLSQQSDNRLGALMIVYSKTSVAQQGWVSFLDSAAVIKKLGVSWRTSVGSRTCVVCKIRCVTALRPSGGRPASKPICPLSTYLVWTGCCGLGMCSRWAIYYKTEQYLDCASAEGGQRLCASASWLELITAR